MSDHVRVHQFQNPKKTFCSNCERLNSLLHDIMGRVLDGANMVTYHLHGTSYILGMVTLGYVIYALLGIEHEFGLFREWFGGPHLCWDKP